MRSSQQAIGNTPLLRAAKLGTVLGLDNLFLKYERSNPTGTQKDRVAYAHIKKAKDEGYDTVVVGSCGNYGASIAYYASLNNMRSYVYIPKGFHSPRLSEIEKRSGAKLVLVEGKYEDSVEASKNDAKRENWFDANAGAHPELGLEAYAPIAKEIVDELGSVPDTVSIPVGNGTTLAGVYHGFERLKKAGQTDRVPRIIAASTDGGNPIIYSFKNRLPHLVDFPVEKLRETEINEPLVNYHSYDGELAFLALVESNGFAEFVTDEELSLYSEMVTKIEGLPTIPAAAASIAATVKVARIVNVHGHHVSVLTG